MTWQLAIGKWTKLLCFSCINLDVDFSFPHSLLDGALTLKIADFGLTLKKTAIQLETLGKVPVKWLAKEVSCFHFPFLSFS